MLRILSVTLLLAAIAWSPAHAETTQCTEITSIPATISTQGVYCLKHDLSTALSSGVAITIATNNVTIDCNDFKIGGLAGGVGTNMYGIEAASRVNLTIRHCGVRGFDIGISLEGTGSGGHLIEDNRIDLNTNAGLNVEGDNLIVRRNRILQTGGRPNIGANAAMVVNGSGVLTDNFVSGVAPSGVSGNGNAYGMNLVSGPFQAERNFVTGMTPLGTGSARGIWGDSVPSSYRNNTVISIAPVTGVGLDGGSPGPATCGENTVTGFSTDITNCTDAGGNVSS